MHVDGTRQVVNVRIPPARCARAADTQGWNRPPRSCVMQSQSSEQTFQIERFNTPTGRMLLVNDAQGQLRAVDWEDHEERLRQLLRRYYRQSTPSLREVTRKSAARHALDAYFAG